MIHHSPSKEAEKENPYELLIRKQRNGPKGSVWLTWLPRIVTFEPFAGTFDKDGKPQPIERVKEFDVFNGPEQDDSEYI